MATVVVLIPKVVQTILHVTTILQQAVTMVSCLENDECGNCGGSDTEGCTDDTACNTMPMQIATTGHA